MNFRPVYDNKGNPKQKRENGMKRFAFGSIGMMLSCAWFATIIMALCVNTLIAAPPGNDGVATQPDTIQKAKLVRTDRGVIRGKTVDNVDQFLGVPYAAPPIGDLRWRAPIPAERWHGVRDATKPARVCAQIDLVTNVQSGSEDCLYLNIYRPKNTRHGESLPVLVWIHGRNDLNGSGNEYDPSEIVEKTGIVVVTINYRLTVFGFLAIPSLDAESDDNASGNYALLDQQAALRWVQRNVRAFGGDPQNVTIAGESAGADHVCANLVSPTATGLFTKAIMQSGRCAVTTHNEATQSGTMLATELACADPETAAVCLRDKATADLLEAAKTHLFGQNLSGRALPLQPLDALRSNQWNRSSILLGSTHDYGSLVVKRLGFPASIQTYQQFVARKFKSLAPAVLNEYKLKNYSDPVYAFAAENTDSEIACQASDQSNLLSMMTETYQYEFNDPDAPFLTGVSIPPGFIPGAYHGSELQYLFKFSGVSGDLSPTQKRLSDQMMQYWANFARTGNPNGQGIEHWPLYNPNTHLVLSFKPSGTMVIDNFDADHRCAFWRTTAPTN
jgi:para-nitrobenzyl esterase